MEYLNAASIHPFLDNENDYYKKVFTVKKNLKFALKRELKCPHTIFLTNNTTSGLIGLLLAMQSKEKLRYNKENGFFFLYQEILNNYNDSINARFQLITHICPQTGKHLLIDYGQNLIVDAAQSLGTPFQSELLSTAIFFGPLHKNMGITVGLGLVAVNFDLLPIDIASPIETVFNTLEKGIVNIDVLKIAVKKIYSTTENERYNYARIDVTDSLVEIAGNYGLEVLTPKDSTSHIISFGSLTKIPIRQTFNIDKMNGKYFNALDILRFSFYSLHNEFDQNFQKKAEDAIACQLKLGIK